MAISLRTKHQGLVEIHPKCSANHSSFCSQAQTAFTKPPRGSSACLVLDCICLGTHHSHISSSWRSRTSHNLEASSHECPGQRQPPNPVGLQIKRPVASSSWSGLPAAELCPCTGSGRARGSSLALGCFRRQPADCGGCTCSVSLLLLLGCCSLWVCRQLPCFTPLVSPHDQALRLLGLHLPALSSQRQLSPTRSLCSFCCLGRISCCSHCRGTAA